MKCGRCQATIVCNKCAVMNMKPQNDMDPWANQFYILCEKCSAGLLEWLAKGNYIQRIINEEETR